MNKEESIDRLRKISEKTPICTNGDDLVAITMAIQALSQEPCRKDCRLCKEFDECENGKKGHKNGTSIGYSIGECKDYKPCTDAVSREEAITAIRHAFSWVVPSNPSKEVREIFNKCKENLRELPSVNPQPCDDAISREELLKAIDTWDKFGYTETGCFVRITKEIDNYVPYVHLEDVITAIQKLPPVTQKAGKCKNCKYFEYDSVAKVDGIPLIVAHEICNKWGDGCKTSEDGYCFLFEPQERSKE